MIKSELVTVRDGTKDDSNFIYATFLRGLYYGESWFSIIDKSVFMDNYHKVVEHLLNSPNTLIRVACLREDPDVILGYAVLTKDLTIAHFCFVKKAWRGIGICTQLVPNTVTTVTHLTKTGLSLLKKKDLTFNPFIL